MYNGVNWVDLVLSIYDIIVTQKSYIDITKYNTRYEISVYVLLNGSATVFRLISPYPRYTATQCKIGKVYVKVVYYAVFISGV